MIPKRGETKELRRCGGGIRLRGRGVRCGFRGKRRNGARSRSRIRSGNRPRRRRRGAVRSGRRNRRGRDGGRGRRGLLRGMPQGNQGRSAGKKDGGGSGAAPPGHAGFLLPIGDLTAFGFLGKLCIKTFRFPLTRVASGSVRHSAGLTQPSSEVSYVKQRCSFVWILHEAIRELDD